MKWNVDACDFCGVSIRGHEQLHESELKGQSKSSVSRLWQRTEADLVEETMARDFSEDPMVAVILDKVFLADNLHPILGLGIRGDCRKMILGFRVGNSECVVVCRDLISDLTRHGLHVPEDRRLLAVLDGNAKLRRAFEFFPWAVTQRCLVHKDRNVRRCYLPVKHWNAFSAMFFALRRAQRVEATLQCRDKTSTRSWQTRTMPLERALMRLGMSCWLSRGWKRLTP